MTFRWQKKGSNCEVRTEYDVKDLMEIEEGVIPFTFTCCQYVFLF